MGTFYTGGLGLLPCPGAVQLLRGPGTCHQQTGLFARPYFRGTQGLAQGNSCAWHGTRMGGPTEQDVFSESSWSRVQFFDFWLCASDLRDSLHSLEHPSYFLGQIQFCPSSMCHFQRYSVHLNPASQEDLHLSPRYPGTHVSYRDP